MDTSTFASISNDIADAVAAAAPAVVQVQGRRRPASGVVYSDNFVVTTAGALGRADTFKVRRGDGATLDAELAGWDPTTSLAVLKVGGLDGSPVRRRAAAARVGELAIALARSWSNSITASAGLVSIIGGPLQTGRRRAIAEVFRTSAPMHDGFAGGAFVGADGALLGITTAARIRGLGVVIPAGIAWTTAAGLIEHGGLKRGYLGLAGQPVRLSEGQRGPGGRDEALLIVGITPGSPAEQAGLLVGDVMTEFDGNPITAPEDLLDLLVGERVGRTVTVLLLRGTTSLEIKIAVGERPGR